MFHRMDEMLRQEEFDAELKVRRLCIHIRMDLWIFHVHVDVWECGGGGVWRVS